MTDTPSNSPGHSYKQGGIGAVPGQDAVYGVLFGCGLVPAVAEPRGATGEELPLHVGAISQRQFNLFGLEAEIGFIMGADLPP